MKVAALAQANDLDIAPHGSQYIHIHLVAAIPNGLILEYYRDSVDPMHGKIYKDELVIKERPRLCAGPSRPRPRAEPRGAGRIPGRLDGSPGRERPTAGDAQCPARRVTASAIDEAARR